MHFVGIVKGVRNIFYYFTIHTWHISFPEGLDNFDENQDTLPYSVCLFLSHFEIDKNKFLAYSYIWGFHSLISMALLLWPEWPEIWKRMPGLAMCDFVLQHFVHTHKQKLEISYIFMLFVLFREKKEKNYTNYANSETHSP